MQSVDFHTLSDNSGNPATRRPGNTATQTRTRTRHRGGDPDAGVRGVVRVASSGRVDEPVEVGPSRGRSRSPEVTVVGGAGRRGDGRRGARGPVEVAAEGVGGTPPPSFRSPPRPVPHRPATRPRGEGRWEGGPTSRVPRFGASADRWWTGRGGWGAAGRVPDQPTGRVGTAAATPGRTRARERELQRMRSCAARRRPVAAGTSSSMASGPPPPPPGGSDGVQPSIGPSAGSCRNWSIFSDMPVTWDDVRQDVPAPARTASPRRAMVGRTRACSHSPPCFEMWTPSAHRTVTPSTSDW